MRGVILAVLLSVLYSYLGCESSDSNSDVEYTGDLETAQEQGDFEFFHEDGSVLQIYGKEESDSAEPLAARASIRAGEEVNWEYGAIGFVVLTERPLGGDYEKMLTRHRETVRAWLATLEDVGEYTEVPSERLMITYWPVSAKAPGELRDTDLIRWYDYARVAPYLQEYQAHGMVSSSTRGPLLVAWEGDEFDDERELLIWDLGGFPNDELKFAFRLWRGRISRDPEFWDRGFAVERLRQTIRTTLNRNADVIVKYIEWLVN